MVLWVWFRLILVQGIELTKLISLDLGLRLITKMGLDITHHKPLGQLHAY